ncbi:MAG: FecR domain-containing protein [Pseudomonadota bacterium]
MLRYLNSGAAFAALAMPFALMALEPDTAAAEIGVLAAVNRDMTGVRPAEQARPVFINERLVANERLDTSENGGGQVLFLDQTSLTIAPNSSIVLDQYVYDPATETGSIGLTVARGAMRMIGGRITKGSPATINTPSATIGIRGGMGNISVSDTGTIYMHVAGISSTIQTATEQLTITQQGGLAQVLDTGAIQYLGIATSEIVAAVFSAAATGSGGGGIPTPASVEGAAGGITGQVSGNEDILDAAPFSTSGEQQGGDFGDLAVDFEVVPTEEFAEVEIIDSFMDDLGSATDAVAFVGLYSGNVAIEGAMGFNFVPFDDGSLFIALNMTTGEGAASIGFPFDAGAADPAQNVAGDLLALRMEAGEFVGVDPTALGGISEGELIVDGGRASGFFILDYFDSPAPLIDANGDTILGVDGTFDIPEVPEASGATAQSLIDAGNLLVQNP